MDLDFLTWNNLMYLIGEITVLIILGALLTAFILVIISFYSIKKGRLYFPSLIRSGLVFLEGLMKAFFRLLGLYVKLWAITPVHHVWTTMPALFIDAVYRFDLKSADGYTVLVTPTAKSFTLEGGYARLSYKADFYKPGELTPFQTRDGWMSYHSDEDTHTGLNIDFPEPKGSAAQELDDLMKQMDDPRLTDAERSDLTVRMVQAQQRMLEEMMNADPAAAQKKTDEFGCRMVQLDPGPDGAVAGGIVCGKNFASGGGLQVTGTMTQVR